MTTLLLEKPQYFSDYKLEEEIVLNISKISKESQIIFKIVLNLH
jgi:hypothetical protein